MAGGSRASRDKAPRRSSRRRAKGTSSLEQADPSASGSDSDSTPGSTPATATATQVTSGWTGIRGHLGRNVSAPSGAGRPQRDPRVDALINDISGRCTAVAQPSGASRRSSRIEEAAAEAEVGRTRITTSSGKPVASGSQILKAAVAATARHGRSVSEPGTGSAGSLKRQRSGGTKEKKPKAELIGSLVALTCGIGIEADGREGLQNARAPPVGEHDNLAMRGLAAKNLQYFATWDHRTFVNALRGKLPILFRYLDGLQPRPDGKSHWILGYKHQRRVYLNFNPRPDGETAFGAAGRRTINERVLYIVSREEIPEAILRRFGKERQREDTLMNGLEAPDVTTDTDDEALLASPSTWTGPILDPPGNTGKGKGRARQDSPERPSSIEAGGRGSATNDADVDSSSLSEIDSSDATRESVGIKSPPRKVLKTYRGAARTRIRSKSRLFIPDSDSSGGKLADSNSDGSSDADAVDTAGAASTSHTRTHAMEPAVGAAGSRPARRSLSQLRRPRGNCTTWTRRNGSNNIVDLTIEEGSDPEDEQHATTNGITHLAELEPASVPSASSSKSALTDPSLLLLAKLGTAAADCSIDNPWSQSRSQTTRFKF